MKRFLVIFTFVATVELLLIFLLFNNNFNFPLTIFISAEVGLITAILLNFFSLKRRLTAEVDFSIIENKHQNSESTIYSYSFNWKQAAIPLILSLVVIIILAVTVLRNRMDNYAEFTLIFIFILSTIVVFDASMTKLIVSEKNIEYQSLFGKTKASWEDIIGAMQLIRGDEVLIFQKVSHSSILIEAMYGDYISVSVFDRKWKTGELGKIIQTFAPQLKFIESTRRLS